MAKPGTNYGSGIVEPMNNSVVSDAQIEEIKKVQVDSVSGSLYNSKEGEVKVRSLFDGRLEYTGQVTGKLYVWGQAGSIVTVSEIDASYLLEKRIGKQSCCGNSQDGQAIFEMVS